MTEAVNPRRIGDNSPPEPIGLPTGSELSADLEARYAALRERRAELLASASTMTVTDEQSAEDATLLVNMGRVWFQDIEALREGVKAPYLGAGREIDRYAAALARPLVGDDPKREMGGPLGNLAEQVHAWRRKKEREAEEERKRKAAEALEQQRKAEALQEEQRKLERQRWKEQEEFRRKQREAEREARQAKDAQAKAEAEAKVQKARADKLEAENRAREAERSVEQSKDHAIEDAATLAHQARRPTRVVIDTGIGAKAAGRSTWHGEIEDMDELYAFLRTIRRADVKEALQKLVDGLVRAKLRAIPGVRVTEVRGTQFRR